MTAFPGRILQRANDGWHAIGRTAANSAADSLGSLLTLTIDDWNVRALLVTGNRVRAWSTTELAEGVVGDGFVLNPNALAETIERLVESLYKGSSAKGRDIAISIGGRTHVQARFTVAVRHKSFLKAAVLESIQERFSVEPGELHLDWTASPIKPEKNEDEDEEDDLLFDDPEEVDEPDLYEAYATGMYRNVVESNLAVIRNLNAWPVDARPRPMALAAAVNASEAIVLDIEQHNFAVVVLRNGLPEIVREMWVEPDAPIEQLAATAAGQVTTTIRYYDSINPESRFPDDAPVFITGSLASDRELVDEILAQVPYVAAEFPHSLNCSPDFPIEEYAANVGMAVTAGKRIWQRSNVKHISVPEFHFIPPEFPTRPRPIRALALGLTVATLILGFGLAVREVGHVQADARHEAAVADEFDLRVEQRTKDLREVGKLQSRIAQAQAEAIVLSTDTGSITGIDRKFGHTVTAITALLPRGVLVREVDDDGILVVTRLSSSTTAPLLEMARALESSPDFQRVSIRSISKGEQASANQPPSAYAIPGIPDLSGLEGLGDFDIPEPPPLPTEPPPADPGLADFFTMTVHLTRDSGEPPSLTEGGATVSIPPSTP